jgi:tRNA(Ile)-lysidine synthase
MNIIQSTLLHFLAAYPKQPILVAYSGGVDSQVLLDCLFVLKSAKKIYNPLYACHVNHGLSKNALQWQQFAQQQCQQRNVALTVCSVNINRKNQQSLEELARDARYKALINTAEQQKLSNALIMTGHHQEDQSETFLLALKRGSGLKGLSAMASSSAINSHLLARPLLNCSRDSIINYANEQQLTWIEDESNNDIHFDRNFLRQVIIPKLKQRWPSITRTISRSSEHCRDGQLLLDELAQNDLYACCLAKSKQNEQALSISQLAKLSSLRFNNVLRYFIASQGYKMPSREQLKQVLLQLHAKEDKSPCITMGKYSLRRFQDALFLTPIFTDLSTFSTGIDLTLLRAGKVQTMSLPDELGLLQIELIYTHKETTKESILMLLPDTVENITITFRHKNPHCLPDYRQHSRPLKKILQELNIAPWQRKRIPFVYFDNELAAALGRFVCKAFSVKSALKTDQPMIKINWLKV